MDNLELLKADVIRANKRYYSAEAKIKAAENIKWVGRYFKYRNCYSCPEKPSDYWWIYARVNSSDSAGLKLTLFQTDQYGKFIFEPNGFHMRMDDGWQETTEAQFTKAYDAAMARVDKAYTK